MPVHKSRAGKAITRSLSSKTKNKIFKRGGAANRKAAAVNEQPRSKRTQSEAMSNARVSQRRSIVQGVHKATSKFLKQQRLKTHSKKGK